MRTKVAIVAVFVTAVTLLAGGEAWAQTPNQSFTFISTEEGRSTVIARGVITGVGTDIQRTLQRGQTSFVAEDELIFRDGRLFVTITGNVTSQVFRPRACILNLTFIGTIAVTGGTGRYAAASGEGPFTGRAMFLFARDPSGQCSNQIVQQTTSVVQAQVTLLGVPAAAA